MRRDFIALIAIATVLRPFGARAEQSDQAPTDNRLFVSIPHHVSKQEALRRLKSGLAALQREYSYLFTIQQETWIGYHLQFRASVLGQMANGSIDVTNRQVYLNVFLPWLLLTLARASEPLIVKEGTLMLEKK